MNHVTLTLDWLPLILYFIAAFGLSYIIGYSRITFNIRTLADERGGRAGKWLNDFLGCVACTGFHIGWISMWIWLGGFDWKFLLGAALCTCGTNLYLARTTGVSTG